MQTIDIPKAPTITDTYYTRNGRRQRNRFTSKVEETKWLITACLHNTKGLGESTGNLYDTPNGFDQYNEWHALLHRHAVAPYMQVQSSNEEFGIFVFVIDGSVVRKKKYPDSGIIATIKIPGNGDRLFQIDISLRGYTEITLLYLDKETNTSKCVSTSAGFFRRLAVETTEFAEDAARNFLRDVHKLNNDMVDVITTVNYHRPGIFRSRWIWLYTCGRSYSEMKKYFKKNDKSTPYDAMLTSLNEDSWLSNLKVEIDTDYIEGLVSTTAAHHTLMTCLQLWGGKTVEEVKDLAKTSKFDVFNPNAVAKSIAEAMGLIKVVDVPDVGKVTITVKKRSKRQTTQ